MLFNFCRYYSHARSPVSQLESLSKLCAAVNDTTSTILKHDILKKYPMCHPILKRIYDPYARYYVSSKVVLKYLSTQPTVPPPSHSDLCSLLDDLSSRKLTGHAARDAVASFYTHYCRTDAHKNTFWRILDRNLKMGVSVATVRRLLASDAPISQTISVALASTRGHVDVLADPWYASQKLDGIRCIATVRSIDDIQFYSRTGRSFSSLERVRKDIQQRLRALSITEEFVLDGEVCAYDNKESGEKGENFLRAMSQVRRSEEMKDPIYQVFDRIKMEHFLEKKGDQLFSERQRILDGFIGDASMPHIKKVKQVRLESPEQLDQMKQQSVQMGWEGLILRKDTPYEGKRTRNMIKLKEWEDAEYIVKGIETGWMRMPDTGENRLVLTSVNIEHKGYPVSVGSGFSWQHRIEYAECPSRIIGKPITVRYFSESNNRNGTLSLRFPTVKAVYESGERDL